MSHADAAEGLAIRPSLRERKQQMMRTQILQACVEIQFVHGGYENPELLTYSRVAELAGVSERTVYRMFPTKRDLVRAVVEERQELMGVEAPRSIDGWPAAMHELGNRMDATFARRPATSQPPADEATDEMPEVIDARRSRDDLAVSEVRKLRPGLPDRQTMAIAAVVQAVAGLPSIARTAARWDLTLTESADAHAWALKALIKTLREKDLDYDN